MRTLQTVTGPVDAGTLGIVLCHEHLFNDLAGALATPSYAFSRHIGGRRVAPDIAWVLRQDPYSCADNLAAKEVADVVAEVRAFAAIGGGTIVDATGSAAIGRDPERLVAVARATGLNVVMSSGPYLERFEGARITARTVEEQAQEILQDLDVGVGETGVRAGMIGEIGVSPAFTPGERAALRAAALAQTERPEVALNVHLPGWLRRGDEVLDIVLDECGCRPEKVTLAHSDPSGADPEYQRRLLDRGVWLEFDMIGLDISFPGEGVAPGVAETTGVVARLVRQGYAGQLLLSHDVFLKQMWTRNGGNGFAFVPEVFPALLERAGVDPAVAAALLTDNPARALTG